MRKIKKDIALKNFWNDNDRFVDLFNTIFFQGKKVLRVEDMQENDTDVSTHIFSKEMQQPIESHRDVVKCAYGMKLMVLGIENQDKIHYAMPLRCRIYDDLQYLKQVKNIVAQNKKEKNWKEFSEDEFLSGMRRDDKINPCLTIVIYYGEKAWDGPKCLSDMIDMPKEIEPFFQDYKMQLISVRDEDGSSFTHEDVKKLFYVLNALYHDNEAEIKEKNVVVNMDTYQAIASVQKNEKLLSSILQEEKGEVSMCSALERIWQEGRQEGRQEVEKEVLEKLLAQGILLKEQIAEAMGISLEKIQEMEEKIV